MDATRTDIPSEWLADFEAASRRPLALRLRYTFIHTAFARRQGRYLFIGESGAILLG